MQYTKGKKIKMATRIKSKKKDEVYDEFFKDEVGAVMRKAKKPDLVPSLIDRNV